VSGGENAGVTLGPPLDLARHTGFLVRRTQQAHLAAWAREVGGELTNVQFGVLNVLCRLGEASQRELCDELDLDRSTVAGLVARLEARGLVARARAAHDRRRNVVRLTAEGERVLRDTVDAAARVDGRLTAPLTPAERAELQRLLTRVLEAASRD
jgi:DNA-binding MarR family transcriptional regulator